MQLDVELAREVVLSRETVGARGAEMEHPDLPHRSTPTPPIASTGLEVARCCFHSPTHGVGSCEDEGGGKGIQWVGQTFTACDTHQPPTSDRRSVRNQQPTSIAT